ncbi:MAG TPA: hypothetical protein VF519_16575 [Mycobacteriales bacterium]
MTPTRRALLRAALATPLLAACAGKDKPKAEPTSSANLALENVGQHAAPGLQIGEAEAEVVAGQARYAFGLIGPDGPLAGATVKVYLGREATAPPEATVDARELEDEGLADRGLYAATLPFPAPGKYLLAIVAETPNGAFKGGIAVDVLATSKSPIPGQKAVSVKTPTTKDPAGASPLCSRRPNACSMHAISLDAAIASGKPTVVVFAAPAFCQTELCGPDVDILEKVARRHAGKANFVHVEAYVGATTPTNGKLAPALKAYRFDSEPWLYFIDAKGIVSDRISAAFVTSEVEERLAKLGVA